MAVVLEIIDLVVCWKIHGCGCVADDPTPRKSIPIPILLLGAICLPCGLALACPINAIGESACLMAAFSGF